jgi:hypothetical protein
MVVGAGISIQIAEGSAAVGVKLFPCWCDSACNLCFVLGLCDVFVHEQGHVLILAKRQDFGHFVLVILYDPDGLV